MLTFLKKINPFFLFVIIIALALTIPQLLSEGMFMDAVLYTSVSKNMAQGYGSFWFPRFSYFEVGGLPSFHEQPPLVFWMVSMFFRIIGDYWFTERLYVLVCLLVNVFIIHKIWCLFNKDVDPKLSWIAILLWIIIPVCFWSFQNNMHENTMGIFTSASIYFYLKWRLKNTSFIYAILSVLFLGLAALSKGFPGLFPIAVPVIYETVYNRKIIKGSLVTLMYLLSFGFIVFLLVTLNDNAYESLKMYAVDRAFKRIGEEVTHTVSSRYYIIGRLFSELLVPIGFVILIWGIDKFKLNRLKEIKYKHFLFFFLLGLAGSMPLILTKVQKGFYFVAALPCFGLAFAILVEPMIHKFYVILSERKMDIIRWVSVMILLVGLVLIPFNYRMNYNRDKEILQDVEQLEIIFNSGEHVMATKNLICCRWSMRCYLVRYSDIHLIHTNQSFDDTYLLSEESSLDNYSLYRQLNTINVFKKLK